MIPKQIQRVGSLNVSSSSLFERLHRLVKAYTKRSNKAKLGAVEGQVIRNSVTSRFVQKPLSSVKARLYHEEHASRETSLLPETEESDEEDTLPLQFRHDGTGETLTSYLIQKCIKNFLIQKCIKKF